MDPCSTPEVTGTVFEVTRLYRTNWLRPVRYDLDTLNDPSPDTVVVRKAIE